ncbi:MAG: hypothetical protein ACKVOB_03110 [Sphingomonas sp.]
MAIAMAALALGEPQFYGQMKQYIACLQRELPADISSRDRSRRIELYHAATARCQREREAAIAAAVRERPRGTSEAQARQQAIAVIDDLAPSPRK